MQVCESSRRQEGQVRQQGALCLQEQVQVAVCALCQQKQVACGVFLTLLSEPSFRGCRKQHPLTPLLIA